MALEWFEYYDVKGDIRSLRQEVEVLKKQVRELMEEYKPREKHIDGK